MESGQESSVSKLVSVGILFIAYKAVEEQREECLATGDRSMFTKFCSDLSLALDSHGFKSTECLAAMTQTEETLVEGSMQLNEQPLNLRPITMSSVDGIPELKCKGRVRSLNAFLASIHNASLSD